MELNFNNETKKYSLTYKKHEEYEIFDMIKQRKAQIRNFDNKIIKACRNVNELLAFKKYTLTYKKHEEYETFDMIEQRKAQIRDLDEKIIKACRETSELLALKNYTPRDEIEVLEEFAKAFEKKGLL